MAKPGKITVAEGVASEAEIDSSSLAPPPPIPASALLTSEEAVRFFAARLAEAIAEARREGYVVTAPDLSRITISATAKSPT